MVMPYWTIEEVAENLNLTVAQVRESRRRKEWPGVLGRMRGRRLQFDVDLVQAGPQVAESTTDVSEAILWTLQGIEGKLADIHTYVTTPRHHPLPKSVIVNAAGEHDEEAIAAGIALTEGTFYIGKPPTTTQGDEEE